MSFSFLHLELTSRCNKSCWMCGRRKMERERPELCDWGDMPMEMVHAIAEETPAGVVVQFHNSGEPLLYDRLPEALSAFDGRVRCFNTNGKLLLERGDAVIGRMETLTVSVIEKDPEGEEQYETVRKFIERKGDDKPVLVYRLLGKVDKPARWERLPGLVARRVLHRPEGSFGYRREPVVPEVGICLDLLTHLAVDRYGNISLCVRLDPEGELRIGKVKGQVKVKGNNSLGEAWRSEKRGLYLRWHVAGRREMLPGCAGCEFWGVPRG